MAAVEPKQIDAITERLEGVYGKPRFVARFDPMEELISCILSQHTADANSFPTFQRLREKYATWEQVANLSPESLAKQIQKAGLANQKSKSILGSLKAIKHRFGDYTLDPLRKMSLEEGRAFLTSLPGVGPKTAAIVLLFSFGKPTIPVDTHVFRVSWRIGLIEKRIGEARAHAVLENLIPAEMMYRAHVALIQHGRNICKARNPECSRCPIRKECDFATAVESPRNGAHDLPAQGKPSPRSSAQHAAKRKGRASRGQ